jgi:alanyl-tRNA synthetase
MGRGLSTSIDELPAQIGRFKDEIARLKDALKAAESEKLALLAEAAPADEPDVILFTAAADAKTTRDLINRLVTERSGICAVFTGSDEDGYSFIIGSGSGLANEAMTKLKTAFNARGGGKPAMVQG